jgi:predicted CXXCH cytochrome family protein
MCKLRYKAYTLSICLVLISIFFITGTSYPKVTLRTDIPELCYKCHEKLRERLSDRSVHFPFKNGKCAACHNPHTGDVKGLLNEQINSLCLDCHEAVRNNLKKANIHGALMKGSCSDCHYPHSGENPGLLVKNEKELCWGCHEDLKEQLNQAHIHSPFNSGECSSCHDPHGSSQEYQLLASPNKTCKKCHSPRCNVKGVSITHITKDKDCASCHSGHASNVKGLLGPFGHSAFLEKKCDYCHNAFLENKPVTTYLSGQDLCFSCHEKDPAKFRENDVHWSISDNPCKECHVYHASKQKSYTVQEANLCYRCHDSILKKFAIMKRTVKNIKIPPLKQKKCFACHKPLHSYEPYYLRADVISVCNACHEAQHRISHPLGEKALDPRNGKPMDCISCHSMHSAKADYLMSFDKQRELCIQCHKL